MKKTAIRITSAELAAEEYRAESRRDIPRETAPESTLQLLRRVRDRMSERDLLKLSREAARLELRGDQWDSEDRADCAAEVMWHILAEHEGAPPLSDSPRARITHACGIAKNWRAAQLRRRAMEARAEQAAEDAYALSPAAMLDSIPDTLSAEYLAERAAQDIAAAHDAAAAAIARLELTPGGPVHAAFYQWARGASGDQCAAENDVAPATWRKRVERGGALIRAAFPDLGALCEAMRESDPPAIYRRARIRWQDREGTDGGSRPTRAGERRRGARGLLAPPSVSGPRDRGRR